MYPLNLPVEGTKKELHTEGRNINKEYLEKLSEWVEEFVSIQISPDELNDIFIAAINLQEGYDKDYYECEEPE